MSLPEGLSALLHRSGELEILDAQSWVWLTIHPAAKEDPLEWRETITQKVLEGLGVTEIYDEEGDPVCLDRQT